jgi:hypothetical protein
MSDRPSLYRRLFYENEGHSRYTKGWVPPVVIVFGIVSVILASVCLFQVIGAVQCSNMTKVYGVRSEYYIANGCFLENPDGSMVPESKWWGYEEPTKSDLNVTLNEDGEQ